MPFSGLFHRVILMSGSLFAPWARVRDPLDYAMQMAAHFNCSVKEEDLKEKRDSIEQCLRYTLKYSGGYTIILA